MKKLIHAVQFIAVVFTAFFASQLAAQTQFVEGRDYIKVAGIPEATKPVVREFFSYNCPHCYRQDGFFNATMAKLDGSVDFERTPVGAGRPSWQLSQEAYYLAQKFQVTSQAHGNLFKRIHEGKGAFTRQDELTEFFVAQGIAKAEVDKAIESADRKLTLANYDTQAQLAGIRGVPALLVNGKYLVTSKTHSADELSALLKYLSTLE
ncbi:thiol:disulfide interchange protein DsbA/DsbL [Shewanella psychrotolerans]|uniref:thiol:disulfide interchange protein DsbA/DsbL n=1 Tax=Shewanella psychrotolerans TaxID=2864206 RepID=UPI001C65EBE2|nr:thiol:disulfide interchange protein DsbA/DsbL [Shewanella psychrotolerans]QYK02732.1 thiol:disulfide interchange protein DsbA/DsbL [Shewanella psychrotolerans]